MSQHVLRTEHNGRPVTVQLGWDRPLQQFYLVVSCDQAGSGADDEDFIYSNLADPQALDCKDLDYFEQKLQELNISVPKSMLREVWNDAGFNVANRHVTYQKDGSFAVQSCGTHHAVIRSLLSRSRNIPTKEK